MHSRRCANSNATPQATELLGQVQALSGTRTLSGQHNTPRERSFYSDQAAELTGHYPAVWGQDFGFARAGDMDGVDCRQDVVDEAIRQHAAGSIVTLMWHAARPTGEEPVTFLDNICAGPLDDEDWRDLLTPGTEVHARWIRQVDVVAALLAQLRDARVPVLWRPYHEMNGDWFWWGARPGGTGYAALYRQLYERLVTVHRLDNLVWVWNANAPRADAVAYGEMYPGHDVVDILAADVYAADFRQSHHDDLVALADGRPVALGEVGVLPSAKTLAAQPQWAWFMTWSTFLNGANDAAAVRALFDDPRVLHRPAR